MPRAKTEDHTHADLVAEVAALKKELAALKRTLTTLKSRGGSGADPRVDKIWEVLSLRNWVK